MTSSDPIAERLAASRAHVVSAVFSLLCRGAGMAFRSVRSEL